MVMSRLRVAMCQLNMVVGDLAGNAERIIGALHAADRGIPAKAILPKSRLETIATLRSPG